MKDGQDRIVNRIKKIIFKSPQQNIVLVTHGDICAALLSYITADSIHQAFDLHEVATGSVSEIILNDTKWKIENKNILPEEK